MTVTSSIHALATGKGQRRARPNPSHVSWQGDCVSDLVKVAGEAPCKLMLAFVLVGLLKDAIRRVSSRAAHVQTSDRVNNLVLLYVTRQDSGRSLRARAVCAWSARRECASRARRQPLNFGGENLECAAIFALCKVTLGPCKHIRDLSSQCLHQSKTSQTLCSLVSKIVTDIAFIPSIHR